MSSPTRVILAADRLTPRASQVIHGFHREIVDEVVKAVATDTVVVVGMSQNPHVKKARDALSEKGIAFTYLEYGGYHSKWRERLAIKLWSGWPTFPQVFVKGRLVGGNSDLRAAMADGSFEDLLKG